MYNLLFAQTRRFAHRFCKLQTHVIPCNLCVIILFVCLIINGCCFQMQNKNNNCPSLTSPNFSLKPEDVGALPPPPQVIRTQALPQINSSIIQTANQKIMNLHTSPYKKTGTSSITSGGKLPLSLSGLLSPRHTVTKDNMTNNVQFMSSMSGVTPTAEVSESALHQQTTSRPVSQVSHATLHGLVSPARMYPSNFSPQSVQGVTSPPLLPGPMSTPPSSTTGLVYLRQDQNIPENFCDKFRPIEPATVATGETSNSDNNEKTDFIDIKNISSDDIVVTLHSVNV